MEKNAISYPPILFVVGQNALGENMRFHEDYYQIVGEITKNAEGTILVRYQTAGRDYIEDRKMYMYIGRLVTIPIRGLEGAARTVEEALRRIASYYDPNKDNLVTTEIRPAA